MADHLDTYTAPTTKKGNGRFGDINGKYYNTRKVLKRYSSWRCPVVEK
jgi:hypothetical protein